MIKHKLYVLAITTVIFSALFTSAAVLRKPTNDLPTVPDNGIEVAVSKDGEQLIKWCARKVVVDKDGFSDIKRTCGWWTYNGVLVKEIK